MPATAILCPGQGSLTPDSADLVRETAPGLYARCAALVGADPFARAAESTRFAQPAIFCASLAGWARIRDDVEPAVAAGHSLGELTALAIAGVLDPDDALELVVLRGRLMAEADDSGAMLALLKASIDDAETLAREHGAVVANDNAPGQVVVSGPRDALASLAAAARTEGLRALELDVAGAFHSPSMLPAVEPFRRALEEAELRPARFPVYSGLTAKPFADVPEQLAAALTNPVRWRETVLALPADRYVDVGPGEVLARLVDRIVPEAAHA